MKNKFPSQWIQKHHKHHTFVCKHDNGHIIANEYPMGEWVEYVQCNEDNQLLKDEATQAKF